MFIGQEVLSPYGPGVIKSIRYNDNIIETVIITPNNWLMDRKQKPTYYLNPKDVQLKYNINDDVNTPFGLGTIIFIRDIDGIYIIQLKKWKLATNKSPTLYLNQSSISDPPVVAPSQVDLNINKSKVFKQIANDYFKNNDFNQAKDNYIEALNAVQYSGDNPSVSDRARILEQIILCQNNAAVCSLKIKSYQECALYANNSVKIINQLEKSNSINLNNSFVEIGVSLDDLFIKWKRKCLYLLGKSQIYLHEYDDAITNLTTAQNLISTNNENLSEYKQLIDQAIKLRNNELKKEKNTWQKAFQRIENEIENINTGTEKIGFSNGLEISNLKSIADIKMPTIDNKKIDASIFGKSILKDSSKPSNNKKLDKKLKNNDSNPSPWPIIGIAAFTCLVLGTIVYFKSKK